MANYHKDEPPAGLKCVLMPTNGYLLGYYDGKGNCIFPNDHNFFRPAGQADGIYPGQNDTVSVDEKR